MENKSIKELFGELVNELELEVQTVTDPFERETHIFNIDGETSRYIANVVCLEEERLFICTVNMGIKVPEIILEKVSSRILLRSYDYIFTGIYIEPESRIVLTRCPMRISGDDTICKELIKTAIYQASAVADAEYEQIAVLIKKEMADD